MRKLLFRLYRILPVRLRWLISYASAAKFVVGILAFVVRDGELLLLEHTYQDAWALPGGWLKRGETIEGCVRRELREELGLDVEVERILRVSSVVTRPVIDIAVLCSATGGALHPDGREVLQGRFFPLHALPDRLVTTHAPFITEFVASAS